MDYRHAASVFVAYNAWLSTQTAALRWFVIVANRDRGGETPARSRSFRCMGFSDYSGVDAGRRELVNTSVHPPWVVGRLLPTIIFVMMVIDLGAFIGTQSENKYGKDTLEVKYR